MTVVLIVLVLVLAAATIFAGVAVAALVFFAGAQNKILGSIPIQVLGVVALIGSLIAVMGIAATFHDPWDGLAFVGAGAAIVATTCLAMLKWNRDTENDSSE